MAPLSREEKRRRLSDKRKKKREKRSSDQCEKDAVFASENATRTAIEASEEVAVVPANTELGVSVTPSATKVATLQLDSDDEDAARRFNLKTGKQPSKEDLMARQERSRLYQMQEAKRRRRDDTAAQGRRSKEKKNGLTPALQKVRRLKTERQAIENEYLDTGGSMKKNKNKKKKRSQGIPLPK